MILPSGCVLQTLLFVLLQINTVFVLYSTTDRGLHAQSDHDGTRRLRMGNAVEGGGHIQAYFCVLMHCCLNCIVGRP